MDVAQFAPACSFASLIVPIHNEMENLDRLVQEVQQALESQPYRYELILIDDGSTDGSTLRILELAQIHPAVKAVILRRNFGQTAAMQAGIDHAGGDVVVTLDGDLQNDPADIPGLIQVIEQGYDLVHGWRKHRQDALLNRRLPSRVANWLISRSTRFPIHDLGCTLKAIRREIAQELNLYGEMHRFIPVLAHLRGARCCEVVTHHRPRIFGKTKYGIDRTLRVILDLLTVWYMQRFLVSPMKLFGSIGVLALVLSGLSGCLFVAMKFLGSYDITGNPLFLFSAISGLASIQFFSLGLLGEVSTRTYFHAARRSSYAIRTTGGWENLEPETLRYPGTRQVA
jgi:glycosyltransferase involved in cell wall biosynthesis